MVVRDVVVELRVVVGVADLGGGRWPGGRERGMVVGKGAIAITIALIKWK